MEDGEKTNTPGLEQNRNSVHWTDGDDLSRESPSGSSAGQKDKQFRLKLTIFVVAVIAAIVAAIAAGSQTPITSIYRCESQGNDHN
jgi:hypothetical protein